MASKKPAKKDIAYITIIVVLAFVLVVTVMQNTIMTGSQKQVLDSVEGVYKLMTESDTEVLSVKDEGDLYRIMLRLKLSSGDVLKEVYATKDGRFFSESGNIMEISAFTETLGKEKEFAECLADKKFLVLGQKNEPNTFQQLLIIGNFANKVYVDCSGANLQACQQIGITEIPTILYNRMNYTGVKTLDWIESLTGCKY
jgi:hypothetical protein